MLSELSGSNKGLFGGEFEKELALLLNEQRRESDDREKELNMYRSGSAPPTIEGSLSSFRSLLTSNQENKKDLAFNEFTQGNGFMCEEQLRGDPSYLSYYYSNVNLNPRLPPPLLRKEDWRFTQKLQSRGGSGFGGIGDRRKADNSGESSLLLSMPPGFKSKKHENENCEVKNDEVSSEWASDGLIGLRDIGLGSNPKSLAENFQDDFTRYPSRLISCNAFENNEVLGASLSRTTTPEPEHIARIPTPIGSDRFDNMSSHANDSRDLVNEFSGMNLSNGIVDQENNPTQFDQNLYFDGFSSNLNYGASGYSVNSPQMMLGQLGNMNLPPLYEASTPSRFTLELQDPMYLEYLRASQYTAAVQNELIQKAYREAIISQQYSQYGYHGNPAFGMGLPYPISPLASPVPNSPGSPFRLGEPDTRFSPQRRSLSLSLLEEFKSNKSKCFELFEIKDHVVEFSSDQYGSRFIQQKLETATTEEKNMVFQEILPQALNLMTDVFGNYVIQKFFEHGMPTQRRELGMTLFGNVLLLSLQMYGCRVIQKAIEVVDLDQRIKMVEELDGHISKCVHDQNGNHVIQKCIECVPEEHVQFIITTFFDNVVSLSTHPYGCRVIQRVLEHCKDPKTQSKVMEEILGRVSLLAQDQYGNYVVQHVLEHGKPNERSIIIQELAGKIVQMSQQKFASNVVEKCLTFGNANERKLLVKEMLGTTDENEPLQAMMKDQFANYVVQKVLETCNDEDREYILSRIKVHLNALKKYTYGKHIVARVEKLVAAGERRVAAQSVHAA